MDSRLIPLAFLFGAVTIVAFLLLYPSSARPEATAFVCPTPEPCKVIFLNKQEEMALTGDRMILETATQGRPLDLGAVVTYFRNKIQNAPNGVPASTPAAPDTPK